MHPECGQDQGTDAIQVRKGSRLEEKRNHVARSALPCMAEHQRASACTLQQACSIPLCVFDGWDLTRAAP